MVIAPPCASRRAPAGSSVAPTTCDLRPAGTSRADRALASARSPRRGVDRCWRCGGSSSVRRASNAHRRRPPGARSHRARRHARLPRAAVVALDAGTAARAAADLAWRRAPASRRRSGVWAARRRRHAVPAERLRRTAETGRTLAHALRVPAGGNLQRLRACLQPSVVERGVRGRTLARRASARGPGQLPAALRAGGDLRAAREEVRAVLALEPHGRTWRRLRGRLRGTG
jgi:hypothetical protein